MKLVLDTNVFISGIFWKGSSNKLIMAWKENKFTLIISEDIIEEINNVLNDFKIQLSKDLIKQWNDLIISNSIIVNPNEKIFIVEDPTDDKFIEAAIAGSADYIISQDKHLLKLKKYRNIPILAPDDFLRLNFI